MYTIVKFLLLQIWNPHDGRAGRVYTIVKFLLLQISSLSASSSNEMTRVWHLISSVVGTDIRLIVEQGLKTAYEGVNRVQISTYWQVGRRIVEEGNHRDGSLDPHSYGLGDGSLIQKEDQSPLIRVQP